MPDPRRLVSMLTPLARGALERAAERALREGHVAVEPEHFLLELCQVSESDLSVIVQKDQLDHAALLASLTASVTRLKPGNGRMPTLAPRLLDALAQAWMIASIDHGLTRAGSATVLSALAQDRDTRAAVVAAAPEVERLFDARSLLDLAAFLPMSLEGAGTPSLAGRPIDGASALGAYTIDLTARARAGKIDPVIGRDAEIRQVIDVLMRRQQNNPILTGPAGVGKTAIVEGLAQGIVERRVPPRLGDIVVRSLDLGQLQAGASMRGEYEQRLRAVLDEASAAMPRVVLFIDEAHMLIGAGNAPGQADAANLLKPALARGELGVIAATTWGEYKRFFEKDPALARRFQVIRVGEPSEPDAVAMVRGLAPRLERHHDVEILEEALTEAVRLSHRFISGRQLPEKAIAVLDTACARIAIARTVPPPALEAAERRCAALDAELGRLRREAVILAEANERLETLEESRERAEEERLLLAGRWALEQEAVARLAALEARLSDAQGAGADELRREWAGLRLELEEVRHHGGAAAAVDGRVVAEVVSGWTGIPVGRMLTDAQATARTLSARMAERIVGQDAAIDTICRRVQTFFADLGEPGKPTGVFLLCGPSGVGKTETAMTLADLLFGGPRALITVNMSEYQEAHAISGLRGAPPGYVGFGTGGVLTEAVRRQPYCVLLLDEIEKAHPDVLELFYQVFDRGMLEDSEGQIVDFTNTLILLTSNVGADILAEIGERKSDAAALTAAVRPVLLRAFPAAFLGRTVVVPYRPLGRDGIEAVTRLKLARLQERFAATGRGELTYHPALVRAIAEQAGATESGARMVDTILTQTVLPALSGRILDRMAEGKPVAGAHLSLAPDGGLAIDLRG